MLTEKIFETEQLIINFAEGDTIGIPLIVLHGSTLNWQSLDEFLPSLERSWHVYACDLPGHGKSGRLPVYDIEEFVSAIAIFLERRVGEPAVLLGFSLGGAIAMGVLARLPELVRGLILLEPTMAFFRDSSLDSFPNVLEWYTWVSKIRASSKSLKEVMARYKESEPTSDEATILRFSKGFYDLDLEFLTAARDNVVCRNYPLEEFLSQVQCPTLLLYGERQLGSIISDEDIDLFNRQVPHALISQIKDAGHGIIWQPGAQKTFEHVSQFLNTQ